MVRFVFFSGGSVIPGPFVEQNSFPVNFLGTLSNTFEHKYKIYFCTLSILFH